MSADSPKKPGGMFQKINQGFSTLKDLTENIERRRQQLQNSTPMSNQVHFTHRSNNTSEDALVIEKRPPTPPEAQRQASGKTNKSPSKSSHLF